MDKEDEYFISGLAGIVLGAGLVIGAINIESPSKKAISIEQENIPKIIKVYNRNIKDGILIEDPDNSGEYITLKDYLKRYDNKYDRQIKRAEIKRVVSQGEGKTQ
jgi:hypothetical protein